MKPLRPFSLGILSAAMIAAAPALPTAALAEVPVIVLINPNSNADATKGMADLARGVAGDRATIVERTNTGVPALLTTPEDMVNATEGVAGIGQQVATEPGVAAIIVSAFSDPGLPRNCANPCRMSWHPALARRRFTQPPGCRSASIVTITPDEGLIESFRLQAEELGYAGQYRGVTVTEGDPKELVKDADALDAALTGAVERSIANDGVQAIIMGGGPLSGPAMRIQDKFEVPLVIAVAAATRAALDGIAAKAE
ncbi:aspartate/glutamate racemase family protein [Paracoccus sp. DMF-8]|uniref:aspartate/glutamate racemase family protein n=1 Tax=Paracoccus sp. DMF-8 TaxID=3019445 RepID=UPI0023E36EEE|nr:aspartate/glutamate racemase family protein [Paracoccus sp. DMF-8]MDF3607965.1 aspartate/glutamate racemase family protein [Paracoccus sp. DMF-8]